MDSAPLCRIAWLPSGVLLRSKMHCATSCGAVYRTEINPSMPPCRTVARHPSSNRISCIKFLHASLTTGTLQVGERYWMSTRGASKRIASAFISCVAKTRLSAAMPSDAPDEEVCNPASICCIPCLPYATFTSLICSCF